MNRRHLVALLATTAIIGCSGPGGGLPATAPATAAPGATIAGKFQSIVDAFRNVLPDLGLSGGTLDSVTGQISNLAGVAASILSGNASVSSLVTNGAGLLQGIADALSVAGVIAGPYGILITAAVNMLPGILSLAGIAGRRMAVRLAHGATIPIMDGAAAEAVVRSYALHSR